MPPAQLTRVRSGAVILGVCGGIARYFQIDPILVRAVFLLLAFYSGLGAVLYLILALLMPPEHAADWSGAEVLRENLRELGEAARQVGQGAAEAVREARLYDRRRQAAGVLLVAVGGLLLLVNLGLLAWAQWRRMWPVLLMLAGVALLARRGERERGP